ncbi:MAG TPA: hypothetical protein VHM16_05690 [Rubrobacteraceae bacterium]|nr:hypothetical protein [Rubrobacteraceae bacterium]
MIRVSVEVRGVDSPLKVLVQAASISRAERLARDRFAGNEVQVVFPIDGDDFFAGDDLTESVEHYLPEPIAG